MSKKLSQIIVLTLILGGNAYGTKAASCLAINEVAKVGMYVACKNSCRASPLKKFKVQRNKDCVAQTNIGFECVCSD